jgi:polar amino acid transport system substrate-binding protein
MLDVINSIIMKTLLLFTSLASLSLFAGQLSSAENDTLRLFSYENPPYVISSSESGSGGESGLAIDVVDALMTRSNMLYQLDIVPAKRGLVMALSQANTCVFPIERSQEREVKFSWVSPVIIASHGFFKNPTSGLADIRTLSDALPYDIGSSLGSGIGEYLESLDFKIDYAPSNHFNLLKLKAKRIDLWASDILSANYIAHDAGLNLAAPELIFLTTLKAMACHHSVPEATIQKLNLTLKGMYQDGSVEKIQNSFAAKHK